MLNLGGTYRAVSPEETLARIEPMLWDKFGITRVANITGLDDIGVPTYVAIRPGAKLLTTAQGKGLTDTLAKVSAMMESIEGWHSEHMEKPALFGSYRALKDRYTLCSMKPSINHGPFEWTDIETMEIPWAKGLELNSGREMYFPYTTVNVNTACYLPGYRYFPPTTNGLASGNTYEEAACHALFEIIERECEASQDCFFESKQLDLSTINSSYIQSLLSKITDCHLSIDIWDISSALDIPTYFSILHDSQNLRTVGMQCGSGTHFSSTVALARTITEALQARLTVISGSRDDLSPRFYEYFRTHRPRLLSLFSASRKNTIPFVETNVPGDFTSCLQQLVDRLNQHGYQEVIVYEHTRKAFGIPVVHVVVPGCRYVRGSCFSLA